MKDFIGYGMFMEGKILKDTAREQCPICSVWYYREYKSLHNCKETKHNKKLARRD